MRPNGGHQPDSWRRIVVGGRCNNNCRICVANSEWQVRPLESLIGDVGAAVQRRAAGVHFTRGELTVHPELPRLLRVLRNARLPWSLATNGRLFAEPANAQAFKSAGLVRATVSLHGFKETHNRLTGTESFRQSVQGIKNLLAVNVRVRVSCLATGPVLAQTDAGAFARFVSDLGVDSLVVRPATVPPSLLERRSEVHSDLGALLGWLAQASRALRRRKVTLEARGLPHCTLPSGVGSAPETAVERTAPACRDCLLNTRCPGFDLAEWNPGDLDFLQPDNPSAPGHLAYETPRTVEPFDVTDCPYRNKERKAPGGHEAILVERKGECRLYRLASGSVDLPVLLHAKIHHGQVWHADKEGTVTALSAAPECLSCPRLHECPALFRPTVTQCLPPEPEAHDRPGFDLAPTIDAACEGEAILHQPVREVWVLDKGADRPRRPYPIDPVPVLRELRRFGVVPLAYELPSPERRTFFTARLRAKQAVTDPFLARHHEGVSLQVTESCMCRCIMCNIVGYFKTPFMPLPRVLRTLEEVGLLGVRLVDLFGGEVTLRQDLFELIRHVRYLGMECMFITTGYYLTPAYVRRLAEAGLNRVVVSIDGSRPETHDPIRQLPGLHRRAVRALRALVKEGSIETFASTVILSENLEDLPNLVALSARLGVGKHEFFLPISGPISSTTPRWPDRAETEMLFETILPQVRKVARKGGVSTDFRPEIRHWKMPRDEAIEMISSGHYNIHARDPESRCQAPGFNLFITVNGNVYPCDMPSVIDRDGALGNVTEESLLSITVSPAMHDFAADAGHYPACRMCVGRYEAVHRDERQE